MKFITSTLSAFPDRLFIVSRYFSAACEVSTLLYEKLSLRRKRAICVSMSDDSALSLAREIIAHSKYQEAEIERLRGEITSLKEEITSLNAEINYLKINQQDLAKATSSVTGIDTVIFTNNSEDSFEDTIIGVDMGEYSTSTSNGE